MDGGDRCKQSRTNPGTETGRGKAGEREKGRGQVRKAKTQEKRTDSRCGSEPLHPWLDRSSQVGLGWEVACRRGLLQALWAPGLKFSRTLEGGPVTGLSPLICDVRVTIPFPLPWRVWPSQPEPQAALPVVSLSHSPVFLFDQE